MKIHNQSKSIHSWTTLWYIQLKFHTICTTSNKNPSPQKNWKEINICSSLIRWVVHFQSTITLQMLQMLHYKHQIQNNFRHSWLLPSKHLHAQNLPTICRSDCSITIDPWPRKHNTGITIQRGRTCTICHKKLSENFKCVVQPPETQQPHQGNQFMRVGTLNPPVTRVVVETLQVPRVENQPPQTLRVEPTAPQIQFL